MNLSVYRWDAQIYHSDIEFQYPTEYHENFNVITKLKLIFTHNSIYHSIQILQFFLSHLTYCFEYRFQFATHFFYKIPTIIIIHSTKQLHIKLPRRRNHIEFPINFQYSLFIRTVQYSAGLLELTYQGC